MARFIISQDTARAHRDLQQLSDSSLLSSVAALSIVVWLLWREAHRPKVERHGHGGHSSWLSWGSSRRTICIASLHHLLLGELRVEELDLLLLVHHDVLVD